MFGAGDQLLEVGEHLTAVAHAQGEAVVAFEKGGELFARPRIEQDGLGPALAGAEHVAIAEAATGDQSMEIVEAHTPGQEVRHVHIHRLEAGLVEGRGHLHLTVHPLLAQDGHPRPGTLDPGCGDVVLGVEGELRLQPRVLGTDALERLLRTSRVVAQRLHLAGGLRPVLLQHGARGLEHRPLAMADDDALVLAQGTDDLRAMSQPSLLEAQQHVVGILVADLDHRPQLLVEQHRQIVGGQTREVDVQAGAPGEGHLAEGDEQTTVGAVVIGQQQALGSQLLDSCEEAYQQLRVVEVGPLLADLLEDLHQGTGSEAIAALTQIDQDQIGIAPVAVQLRGERSTRIAHRGKGRDNQRQRCGHLPRLSVLLPDGLHGHRILAHRDGDAQLRTEFQSHRPHRIVQACVLAGMAGRGHPVGRQLDVAQPSDGRRGDIGDRLTDRHAPRGGRVEQRQRGALAHAHGLAGVALVVAQRDRHIGHRYLPGADHLVARHHAGDGAVADGDEEALVRHRGQAQHARSGLGQFDSLARARHGRTGLVLHLAGHLRRLAEQQRERHVDGPVVEMPVMQAQHLFFGGLADDGIGTALALAQGLELLQPPGVDRQYIALLRLVAPDLHRRHARVVTGHLAQLEAPAATAIVHQLGQGIGQAAGAHVVNEQDGVVLAHLPAAVDDLLGTALHLGVGALHRGKVQVLGRGALRHRRGRAAAQADEHRRSAEHHQGRARREGALLDVPGADVAQAAGEHDGLVVATQLLAHLLLIGAEIAAQVGAAELVVEGRRPDRPFEHDVQCRDDAPRATEIALPGALEARDAQIGHRETAQPGLGLAATPGGALVADLAAGPGGRPRVG